MSQDEAEQELKADGYDIRFLDAKLRGQPIDLNVRSRVTMFIRDGYIISYMIG